MAWALRLSAQAEQDIVDILAWTAVHFNEQQASTYSDTLTLALEALIEGPDALGVKSRNDIAPGVMTLHVARSGRKGRHFVVFRAGGNNVIDVLRVLHDSMDLPRHVDH